jgi:tetraacyldisaccharide 4'-kinase
VNRGPVPVRPILCAGRWREELPGSPWRWALAPLLIPAWAVYVTVVVWRNWWCDRRGAAPLRLPVPVVSVGNLTAGGTGKTPAVLAVCAALRRRGWRPAVLARGYRAAADGSNDEARLMGDVPVVCDPDRHAGGMRAVASGADCVVLDDGAQHRRLHRDVEIILVDATRPGHWCLPLGWLREPWSGLRRADLLWISRAGLVESGELARLQGRLPQGPARVADVHRPGDIVSLDGAQRLSPGELQGRPLVLASGLGNPRSFELAAAGQGIAVVAAWRYPDHHHFTAGDLADLESCCRRHQAGLLITAKDAVKLRPLRPAVEVWVLAVSDALDEAGGAVLDRCLDKAFPQRL